jgi:hypothetical protein
MLSRYELDFLAGKVQLEGRDAINARYRIKKKIKSRRQLIPLLQKQDYLDNQLETSSLVKTDQALLRMICTAEVLIEAPPVFRPIMHSIPSMPFIQVSSPPEDPASVVEYPPHSLNVELAQP